MPMQPRVVVPLGNRAHFGSLRSAMVALRKRGATVLPVLYASALDDRYGDVEASLRREDFNELTKLPSHIDNAMASTTGAALMQWASALPVLKPDRVLIVGDRHEQMAPAIAAAYGNVPIVHQMGGETSGSIDDKIRDSITALAGENGIHCVATKNAGDRVMRLLNTSFWFEHQESSPIRLTGCPRIDTAKQAIGSETARAHRAFLMLSMHPVTTEPGAAYDEMTATLEASGLACVRHRLAMHLFWPNADAGTNESHKAIRAWLNDKTGTSQQIVITTHRTMGPAQYAQMMAGATVLVGNSSSGLREGAWIGTPVVNVGNRQRGREHGANVVDVSGECGEAIERQIQHGAYPSSTLYGDGSAGEKVASVVCQS